MTKTIQMVIAAIAVGFVAGLAVSHVFNTRRAEGRMDRIVRRGWLVHDGKTYELHERRLRDVIIPSVRQKETKDHATPISPVGGCMME